MERIMTILGIGTLAIALGLFLLPVDFTFAEDQDAEDNPPVAHGPGFVDQDGDGYNDNAPDHDNDGIPNGQDPDWTRGQANRNGHVAHRGWGRGSGYGVGRNMGEETRRGMARGVRGFVDENGDGYNDLAPDHDGDGIPNGRDPDFTRGTGMGQHAGQGPNFQDSDGDGVCDNRDGKDGEKGRKGQSKGKKK